MAFKALGLALPEMEESTSYGTPALKVKGKLMARLKEDGESVAIRITWEERERLLMAAPKSLLKLHGVAVEALLDEVEAAAIARMRRQ
ncbi:MmcQ/YjbR family DNA-binding protein [Duganella sp. HH105]|uniref:MmcQ/YjbR family DNA-binding protein n=1 Tax=Duganella sp. HH105 TaxID=1781067 RepID=UPI00114CCD39|nr:hypothetical protein [Duganella sp. HH105]